MFGEEEGEVAVGLDDFGSEGEDLGAGAEFDVELAVEEGDGVGVGVVDLDELFGFMGGEVGVEFGEMEAGDGAEVGFRGLVGGGRGGGAGGRR